jgi:hypothetical protein
MKFDLSFVQSTLHFLDTYLRSWAFLEKLPIMQPFKYLPSILRNPKVHYPIPTQFTPSHPISLRSTLILSTHLRLGHSSGLFPTGFPTNMLYTFLVAPIRSTYPAHLILLHLILWVSTACYRDSFNLTFTTSVKWTLSKYDIRNVHLVITQETNMYVCIRRGPQKSALAPRPLKIYQETNKSSLN